MEPLEDALRCSWLESSMLMSSWSSKALGICKELCFVSLKLPPTGSHSKRVSLNALNVANYFANLIAFSAPGRTHIGLSPGEYHHLHHKRECARPSPAVGICTYEKLDFLERRRESLSRLHYHARIQPESYGAVSMCRSLWIIPKSFPIGFHVTPICRTISSSFLHRPETACDSRSRQAMVDHHNFHAATPPSLLNMFSHTHDRFVFALSQLASGCGEQTLRPLCGAL